MPRSKNRCGTIEIQNRGRVDVYSGENGGVYYYTRANNKIYLKHPRRPKGCLKEEEEAVDGKPCGTIEIENRGLVTVYSGKRWWSLLLHPSQ